MIPILYENKPVGTLEAAQDGLFTVFTGVCEPVCGDRLRLAVFGETARGYLGLMLPERDGKLQLRKRLTRLERSALPQPILCAADEAWEAPEAQRPEPEPPAPQAPPDVLWLAAPDGTLTTSDGVRTFVAIPAERAQLPPGAERLLREIGGRRYLVFPR